MPMRAGTMGVEGTRRQDEEQGGADDGPDEGQRNEPAHHGCLTRSARVGSPRRHSRRPPRGPPCWRRWRQGGLTPKKSSVGKVMSVPEPTIVLIMPAPVPASAMATADQNDTRPP